MRKAFKIGWIALVVALLAVLLAPFVVFLVFGLTGWLHRSERVFSGSVTLDRPPEQVYELLTDYERLPEWFSPCEAVEIKRTDDHTLWIATFANGEVARVMGMAMAPPVRLIWRFTSENRHVSAYWEFELTPHDGGTQLSLSTSGVAHHWVYRLTSDSIIDDEAHIKEFLNALAAESGRPLQAQRNEESEKTHNQPHAGDQDR